MDEQPHYPVIKSKSELDMQVEIVDLHVEVDVLKTRIFWLRTALREAINAPICEKEPVETALARLKRFEALLDSTKP